MGTYTNRNRILLTLGFATYSDYLDSPLWKRVRAAGWIKHGRQCRTCPRPATVLHHIDYTREVLTGENLSLLAPLCNGCHVKVEFDESNQKRTIAEAQSAYRKMLRREAVSDIQPRRRKRPRIKCVVCGRNRAAKRCDKCKRCLKGGGIHSAYTPFIISKRGFFVCCGRKAKAGEISCPVHTKILPAALPVVPASSAIMEMESHLRAINGQGPV